MRLPGNNNGFFTIRKPVGSDIIPGGIDRSLGAFFGT
jgi:hypothetical protein